MIEESAVTPFYLKMLASLGVFVGIGAFIAYCITWGDREKKTKVKQRTDNSVAGSDISFLERSLHPESTHLDILVLLAMAPESIEITESNMEQAEEIRAARLEYLNPKKKKAEETSLFDMDEGGWADEGESEEAKASKAKKEEESKLAKQVAQASGKDQLAKNIKMEGVDEGVLGQKWVENTLSGIGQWPPKLDNDLAKLTFSQKKGHAVTAMSHPAVRRNLCMTMGRLNAQKLNTHPELIQAGKAQLIDATYFKSTMEYRQRTGLLLEAALQVAGATRSYRLYKTIIECVAMFKIGTTSVSDVETIQWFKKTMLQTYGGDDGMPRIIISDKKIETPGEDEIATEDSCQLELELKRGHTENFVKQKIEMAKKMNIPPQVALHSYREGWWVLLRAKNLDGGSDATLSNSELETNPLLAALDSGAKQRFKNETEENRLLTVWPIIVSNVGQESCKAKIRFKAPPKPGRYEILVDVKSQDFLSCDETFSMTIDVADKKLLPDRQNKEDQGKVGDGESKKTQ